MRIQSLAWLLALIVIAGGCRKDAASAPAPDARGEATDAARPAVSDVTLRIRKLGGADGKQLMNQLHVTTPVGDDFTITEQVGARQLELRGKVLGPSDGFYRVSYDYTETSADGRQQLKSNVMMRANTEAEIGKLEGGGTTETIVLGLAAPLNP